MTTVIAVYPAVIGRGNCDSTVAAEVRAESCPRYWIEKRRHFFPIRSAHCDDERTLASGFVQSEVKTLPDDWHWRLGSDSRAIFYEEIVPERDNLVEKLSSSLPPLFTIRAVVDEQIRLR